MLGCEPVCCFNDGGKAEFDLECEQKAPSLNAAQCLPQYGDQLPTSSPLEQPNGKEEPQYKEEPKFTPPLEEPAPSSQGVIVLEDVKVHLDLGENNIAAETTPGTREVDDLEKNERVAETTLGTSASKKSAKNLTTASSKPLEQKLKDARSGPKGFKEGTMDLPETLRRLIRESDTLKLLGDPVAFSRWDDDYLKGYAAKKFGIHKFKAFCAPYGFAGPGWCPLAWIAFCPCASFRACLAMQQKQEVEYDAFLEGLAYHIIFAGHYVWLIYDEEQDFYTDSLVICDITDIKGITDVKMVPAMDAHLQDGIVGGCKKCMQGDLPGLVFRGRCVDGETFCSWQTQEVHTKPGHSHVQGRWEEVDPHYRRRHVCDAEQFAEALMKQKIWCQSKFPAAAPEQEKMRAG